MRGYFSIPGAAFRFFFAAWLDMIFVGIVTSDLGLETIGYDTAMVMTIGIWLVVAPLVRAVAGRSKD